MTATIKDSRRRQMCGLLKRAGWTHERAAAALGVHRVTVTRWATGAIQIPLGRLDHLALKVDLAEAEAQLGHLMLD